MKGHGVRKTAIGATVAAGLALGIAGLGLPGCGGSEEGPAETLGKAIDETTQGAAEKAAGVAEAAKEGAAAAAQEAAAAAEAAKEQAAEAARQAMPDVAAPGEQQKQDWEEEDYDQ